MQEPLQVACSLRCCENNCVLHAASCLPACNCTVTGERTFCRRANSASLAAGNCVEAGALPSGRTAPRLALFTARVGSSASDVYSSELRISRCTSLPVVVPKPSVVLSRALVVLLSVMTPPGHLLPSKVTCCRDILDVCPNMASSLLQFVMAVSAASDSCQRFSIHNALGKTCCWPCHASAAHCRQEGSTSRRESI